MSSMSSAQSPADRPDLGRPDSGLLGPDRPVPVRPVVVRAVQLTVQAAAFLVVLLLSAGTVRWSNAWAFIGLYLLLVLANGAYALRRNPDVVEARVRARAGTKPFDLVLLGGYSLAYLALLVVAGLDAGRFGWAPLPLPVAVLGGALLALSMIPVAGAMAVNRNLEQTVRIQADRGHRVAVTGPYRMVRHPMYLGMLVSLPSMALLLGSALAMVPALVAAILLLVRTAMEDRLLHRELAGYAQYAAATRYRLVPGLW